MPRRPLTSPIAFGAFALILLSFASAATMWVARETAVGPVLVTLSHSHGVHEGDVLAGSLFFGTALLVAGATGVVQMLRVRATRRLGA